MRIPAKLLGIALVFVPTAPGATHTFTKIADNAGAISSFSVPSINTDGVVAFGAFLDGGGQAIYTSNGDGVLTTIADTASGPFFYFSIPPSTTRGASPS